MMLLQMSLQGGVLIGITALLRLLLRDRLPKQALLAFWAAALLRLLLPFALQGPWSPYLLLAEQARSAAPAGQSVLPGGFPPIRQLLALLPTSAQKVRTESAAVSVWTVLWIVGAAATACVLILRYLRGCRLLRQALPLEPTQAVSRWQAAHPLWRPLRILRSDRLGTPLSTGLLRPTIYLPRGAEEDPETLEFILTHEYLHIRHWHQLWKLIALLALCLHWFNLAVWLLVCLLDRDLERVCDEAVLRRCDGDRRRAYALSLLRLAARKSQIPVSAGFSGNPLHERIVSIMKFKNKPLLFALPAILAAAALSLFLMTLSSEAALKAERPAATVAEPGSEPEAVPPEAEANSTEKEQPRQENIFYSWHDMPEAYQRTYLEAFWDETECVSENGTPYTIRSCSARWALENGYPVNDLGETYAPGFRYGPEDVDELAHLGEPELLLASNQQGVVGYIRQSEFHEAAEGREIHTPEEAAAWTADPKSRALRQIPLYLEDGVTVVGYFTIGGD